jgi:hypothetical protein
MRTIFLIASMVCFLIAAIHAGQWGWFGIDPVRRLVDVWFAIAGLLFAASFWPWGRPFRRWFES